jgi:hypothetical protein
MCPGAGGTSYDFSGLDPDPQVCNIETPVEPVAPDPAPKSVTIEPLELVENGCTPVMPPPPADGSASWKTFARACRGITFAACLDSAFICVPTAEPPPEGFSQCVFREGDHECPSDYPDKRVFYDAMVDTRGCSPCMCGDPTGSTCSADLSVYQDALCSMPAGGQTMTSNAPACLNVPPLVNALLGKKVKDIVYKPGLCPAIGGEPVGSTDLMGPSTFCCQP